MPRLLGVLLGLLVAATVNPILTSLWAQTMSPSVMLGDNTAWCATGNCLVSTGAAGLTEVKAGFDGTLWGLFSGGGTSVLYTYTSGKGWYPAASGLQKINGYPIAHISVASATEALAMVSCSYQGNNVYILQNDAWVQLSPTTGCLQTAEIGPDGSIWALTSSGEVFNWNGSAWAQKPGALANISNAGENIVWGVSSSNSMMQWDASTSQFVSPDPPFTPSPNLDAVSVMGSMGVAMLDTSGGIHVSTDGGNTWSTIAGTATSIAGGAPTQLFTMTSAGHVNHVNLTVPQLSVKATMAAPCFVVTVGGERTICGTENMLVTAAFGGIGGAHGTAGVSAGAGATEPATMTATATELGSNCDPFYGNPGDPNCGMDEGDFSDYACNSESGSCNGGESLMPIRISIQTEIAYTQVYWNGAPPPSCGTVGHATLCKYSVAENCTAASTPPDDPVSSVISGDYRGIATYISWISAGACLRFGTSGPWACLPSGAFKNSLNVIVPPYPCTHNP